MIFMETMGNLRRTHYCGTLRARDAGTQMTVAGSIAKCRDKGGVIFADLRDTTGILQLIFDDSTDRAVFEKASGLKSEYVVIAAGTLREREAKTDKIPTGEVELFVTELRVLSGAQTTPFEVRDGINVNDQLRLKYRYLDLRRPSMHEPIVVRSKIAKVVRDYYDEQHFVEIETPMLIKSTPEGARDYLVPSRVQPGHFYALPQSPQLYKQILMLSGFDRYYQIVRCFRDEDLRADRQPEFTQIDCEMSFVEQEDVLEVFEGLISHLFKEVRGVDIPKLEKMTWMDAMEQYGCDKPDLRFGMKIVDLTAVAKGKDFAVFNDAEYIGAICAPKCAGYTRKQLDELTEFVKRSQIGAKGLVYVKYNEDGTFKSSVDKFYTESDLKVWAETCKAEPGDLILILVGPKFKTLPQLCELRLEMGNRLGLRDKDVFKPLWVVDFPLLEWDEETQRFYAMHHPFTSPKPEDIPLMDTDPGKVRANAYDMVINGVEVGGGSIRIHDSALQSKMFDCLGFTHEAAQAQFGFLMGAFKFGAPPHGGIAFGFDRLASMFAGLDSIRDVIAFPKNNSGRDVMIDSPSEISPEQFKELGIQLKTN